MTSVLRRNVFQISNTFQRALAYSTVPEVANEQPVFKAFRTPITNPAEHESKHLGLFYTIPDEVGLQKLFKYSTFQTFFKREAKLFNELSILVRSPALELIHYLKNANYDHPVNKYVLYGRFGSGKSTTLAHVIHYAYLQGWLIVHAPFVKVWTEFPKTIVESTTRPGYVDLPVHAVNWLLHFKVQNQALLNNPELTISNDYEWNVRESSKKGQPLLELVDFGINRGNYSSEVLVAVLQEIKLLSKSNKARTLVVIDGISSFFHYRLNKELRGKIRILFQPISFMTGFLDITKGDWHNGAVVVTVDQHGTYNRRDTHLPLYQLGLKGFEHFDPFIPIEVPLLSDKEMTNIITYYKEKKWLRKLDGDNELKFISGGNGLMLSKLCAPL